MLLAHKKIANSINKEKQNKDNHNPCKPSYHPMSILRGHLLTPELYEHSNIK